MEKEDGKIYGNCDYLGFCRDEYPCYCLDLLCDMVLGTSNKWYFPLQTPTESLYQPHVMFVFSII